MKQRGTNVIAAIDHFNRISKTSAVSAIMELIWNALDAGGNRVDVTFETNSLGGVEAICVKDQGIGIKFDELDQSFETIGDSLKKKRIFTPEGRIVHGSLGQGRFKGFTLGGHLQWTTVYESEGLLYRYTIDIHKEKLNIYEATDVEEYSGTDRGTTLRIDMIFENKHVDSLLSHKNICDITQQLALYLTKYRKVSVYYDRQKIDPESVIKRRKKYVIDINEFSQADMTIIEWSIPYKGKKLCLCGSDYFVRKEIDAIVRLPGYDFTAYLKSELIDTLYANNELDLEILDPLYKSLINSAKCKIKEYFTDIAAEDAAKVVKAWKDENIYPYTPEEIQNPLRNTESKVFDIIASRLHEHHKSFRDGSSDSKELTLRLLRQAIENEPENVLNIIGKVLRLPKDKQDELAELLDKTNLQAIINATSIITKRLHTVSGFEEILFEKEWNKRLRERSQLHRILVNELWIFGEEYTLSTDDESMKQLLKQHIRYLGRNELAIDTKNVDLITDKTGIPDLMLSRRFVRPRNHFEHLVIELKAPSVRINSKEISQIKEYAYTVSQDDRFSKSDTVWTFVLIGNSLASFAEEDVRSDGLPYGCIHKRGNLSIWIKTWGEIIDEVKYRYNFFREKLEVEVTKEDGLKYLLKKHEEYFKPKIKDEKTNGEA